MRLKSIEGIRGIATLMVFFSHFAVMFYPAFYWGGTERSHCNDFDIWIGQTPISFFLNGNSGVMIFLILTGFGTYMLCCKSMKDCARYISLRYFKLFILTFIASASVWLLFKWDLVFALDIDEELLTPWFGNWNPMEDSYFSLVLQNPLESLATYNGVLWTMKYMFVGTIVSVVMYLLSVNCAKPYLVYFLSIVVLVNMKETYYIPCVLGVFLADVYNNNKSKRINLPWGIVLAVLGIYLCAYPTGMEPTLPIYSFLPYEYCHYYHILGAGSLVYISLFWPFCVQFLEKKFFQIFGKHSMSIYVLHYGIIISFSAYLYTKLCDIISYNITVILIFIFTSCIVMFTSCILSKLVNIIFKRLTNTFPISP